jgi:Family of unknown function (DUF5302)
MTDTAGNVEGAKPDDSHVAETPAEANRRKFLEALARKKLGHHGSGGSADPKMSAPHSAPGKPQRTFRRKSGSS